MTAATLTATETLSFVIPAYNECQTLAELAERCSCQAQALGLDYRIIFVDDGSTDGSREVLARLAEENPRVTVLFLRARFGKSAALSAGFEEADSQWVVTLDADLQDQPEELGKLLEAARAGADVVGGCRVQRCDPLRKRINSRLFNGAVSLVAGQHFTDSNSGFKLYRREVLDELVLDGSRHRLVMLLAAWKGYRVAEVPVRHEPRRQGRSKYGPGRAVSCFFDLCAVVLIEKFRNRPLHFFGSLGLAIFGVGALCLAWIIGEKFLHRGFVTNRVGFYVGILFMILGMNVFTTGMLAELHNAQYEGRRRDYVRERLGAGKTSGEGSRRFHG